MAIDAKTEGWNALASGKTLVAADFWAPWCPYCKMLKPVFESVAENYPSIKFVKINVDEEPELASRYGIQGIPVIKFFCEGREVGEIVGYVPKETLKDRIDEISNNVPACLANTSLKS